MTAWLQSEILRFLVHLFEHFEPTMGIYMSDAYGGVNERILIWRMAKGSAAIVMEVPTFIMLSD